MIFYDFLFKIKMFVVRICTLFFDNRYVDNLYKVLFNDFYFKDGDEEI